MTIGDRPDEEGWAVQGQSPRYLSAVRRTALYNLSTSVLSAVTGVFLARLLGAAGRGDYAAVTALFGLVLVGFELGLPASVVFFAAKEKERADSYVRVALAILLPMACVGSLFIVIAALTFMGGPHDRTVGLILATICVVASFTAAPPVFALQAIRIPWWNIVRISQPLLLAAGLSIFLILPKRASTAVAVLAGSLLLQALLAWLLYRKLNLQEGRFSLGLIRPLLRYGVSNAASTAPNAVNGRIDQVVLAFLVAPAALGQYAVAVSLSLLVSPLAVAFGNVAFPRIAGGDRSESTVRQAVRGAFGVAFLGVAAVTACAPFIVPMLYGADYPDVTKLLFILAPGAVFFVVNQVFGDLLRGMGRPGLVAASEWAGVLVTVTGLVILAPRLGPLGAAVTSSAAYFGVFALRWRGLRNARRSSPVSVI